MPGHSAPPSLPDMCFRKEVGFGSNFTIRAMTDADITPVYSVINATRPDIRQAAWHAHARASRKDADRDCDTAGCTLLACPDGYIYGLFAHLVRRSLGSGHWLEVDDLCAVTPVGRKSASETLLQAVETVARRSGCPRISLALLDDGVDQPDQASRDALQRHSFVAVGPRWSKQFA